MGVYKGKLNMIEAAQAAGLTEEYKVNALQKVVACLDLLERDLNSALEIVPGNGSREQPKLKEDLPYYLVGDKVSLADLSWACVLFNLIL